MGPARVNRNLYGLMIKYPEPGRVKTRLARVIGPEQAALISRQTAETVVRQTSPDDRADIRYDRYIFYDPPDRGQDFVSWLPDEAFILQSGRDVGERMDAAVRHLIGLGAARAVITGADIPGLSREILVQAFELLDHADVVLGPALDGGYYLIGMKKPMPELFHDIPWSSPEVLSETLKVLSRLNRSYSLLPALSDLDTIEDLHRQG
ncbi:MAG: glycosyltransferase [Nitrospirae bacterium]|nr:MAG: glycosyltransferase [Nitrospirota bacterium]